MMGLALWFLHISNNTRKSQSTARGEKHAEYNLEQFTHSFQPAMRVCSMKLIFLDRFEKT